MGATATKMAQKSYSYITGSDSDSGSSKGTLSKHQGIAVKATAFVLTRSSSKYFDEDGQLANEFYCEVRSKSGKKRKLKKIKTGLTPQGEVPLKIARLHFDYPVVLYEAR
ncbi:tumor suppressor candidate 2-like [Styela clava]|uniref:tumor suppressor candidate 2-like n=1 Tax=Styela clava TaxID=7725 RepID=UPI0019392BA3|nr:tumor suppressor candidate 2-like [Styela clava]